MAENVQETGAPEPPSKPPEVPKPTEQSSRPEALAQPGESQQSAQQDARSAAQSEYAKAINDGPEGLRPTPEFPERLDEHTAAKAERDAAPQDSATAQPAHSDAGQRVQDSGAGRRSQEVAGVAGDRDGAVPAGEQAGEHAAARQAAAAERAEAADGAGMAAEGTGQQSTPEIDQPAVDNRPAPVPATPAPEASPPEGNSETDEAAETAARITELRHQGHGPQRHHDPTDEKLAARMGDPILDPQSGQPLLKDNGHVRAHNHIDPMTGTTVDGVHGGVHRCGDYATRIDSPDDYVAADRYMRGQIGDTGPAAARRPISEVLGSDAHQRMTGYYHDPNAAGQLKPVDFEGGTVFALYERLPNGDLNLRTMYVDPAPPNPDQ